MSDEHPEDAGDDQAEEAQLVFGSAAQFFAEFLRYVYRRPVGTTLKWSAEWWRCDEAVLRIEALWRSWESLRQDPATGMSVWYRDHADHHMSVLLSADGPFSTCRDRTAPGDPLPHADPPAGMFPDTREA